MFPILLAALASLLPTPIWPVEEAAQPDEAVSLPDSPQGRAAEAFIEMINVGSAEASRGFEETYRAASRGGMPAEERAARVAQMHEELAPLSIKRVLARPRAQITVVATAREGQTVLMEFVPAADGPGRIDGVKMSIGGSELEPEAISAAEIEDLVEGAAKAIEDGYVYPDVGSKMAASVRDKLRNGGYAECTDDVSLAGALMEDMRAVSKDLHLSVQIAPEAPAESAEHGGAINLQQMAGDNYGFREAKILPGNIGYLRLDLFIAGEEAERTGAGAMAFLRECDAVVFDLRSNGGGDPEMIRFLTSYLFDEPTHLNDMVDRTGEVVEEYWTLETVPGERLARGTPVFVLTSPRTGSGAEEFSYNLKNLKRGTIVGERTWGGAHPIRSERIGDRLVVHVPYMRARNPISMTNWEGVGVEPDIEVPADEALDRALELARKATR